jgi:sugar lactone lactonase YvrE
MAGGERRVRAGLAAALAAGALLAGAGPAAATTFRVFAPVPSPGQPEGIAVNGDTVYAGTETAPFGVRPEGTPPSKLFAWGPGGTLRGQWTIQGEQRDGTTSYGLFGLALDRAGVVYAVEHGPASILALDPRTGTQREYARFRDVPSCQAAGRTTECSATTGDLKPFPNFAVFAPDGTMYVTDLQQALIWRIPPGGGRPEVWFTDPRLEAFFGPNGAQLTADGRTLMFVVSQSGPAGGAAGLYTVAIGPGGRPGPLRQFWAAGPNDAPDGFQIARSGNVWVVAAGAGQLVVLSSQGAELRRLPQPGDSMDVPFDAPANIVLLGEHALVTNHAWVVYAPPHWAIIDVSPAEAGLPWFRPPEPPIERLPCSCKPRPARLRLVVSPRRIRAGRRTTVRFRVLVPRRGHLRPVRGATVLFAGRRRVTGRDGRARMTVTLSPAGTRYARATLRGYLAARAATRVSGRPRR